MEAVDFEDGAEPVADPVVGVEVPGEVVGVAGAFGLVVGGPAVSAGKGYLLDRDDKVGDTLRVYDLSNGKELWNFAYAGPGKVEFPGSRSTPTVDGERVYTVGMVGDLYCFSTTTQRDGRSRPSAAITWPGVQYPHWSPCSAMNPSCSGWSLPSCSRRKT